MTLRKSDASSLIRYGRLAGTVSACVPIALGLMGLAGWKYNIFILATIYPGMGPINSITAMGLIFAGAALLLLFHPTRIFKYVVLAVATLLISINGLRLLCYFMGWEYPLDQILFREKFLKASSGHNGIAPNTAFNFVLLGSAFVLAVSRHERARNASQYLSILIAFTSYLGLLGYLLRFASLYQIRGLLPMALPTVLGFLFAATGSLCLYPKSGPVSLLFSDSTGGFMARRLMPVAVFTPTLASWIFLSAHPIGNLEALTGIARFTFVNILIASLAVYSTSQRLHIGDRIRMRAEEEVLRMNSSLQGEAERLIAANKGLEAFSYSVSHDLRSPLTHVKGYTEMLMMETAGKLEGKAARYLDVIQSETTRMGALIEDLLAFAKVERADLRMSEVSMQDLVQEIIRRLEPETQGRKVVWHIQNLPRVKADRSLLEQVLVNLLSNALKYSRKRAESRVEIGSRPSGDGMVVFYVRDNGAGFDMRSAGKLFEAFQRMHSSSEFEGTGVGLANVRSIIQRHGGEVWAESEVDKGATFFFSLSLA